MAASNTSRPAGLLTTVLLLCSIGLLFAMPWLLTVFNNQQDYYGLALNTEAPAFALKDTTGKQVQLSALNKQYVYLMFGFTGCRDTCHVQVSNLLALKQRLKEKGNVLFAFISLDPERDTPDKLHDYFATLGDNFVALRPQSHKQAQALAADYHEYAVMRPNTGAASPDDLYQIDHNGYIYLIAPDNKIKLMYTPVQLDHLRMENDYLTLLTQS